MLGLNPRASYKRPLGIDRVLRGLSYDASDLDHDSVLGHEPKPGVGLGEPVVTGGVFPEARLFARSQLGGFLTCYESSLAGNPSLEGHLDLQYSLNEHGYVGAVSAKSNETLRGVAQCIEKDFRRESPVRPTAGRPVIKQPLELELRAGRAPTDWGTCKAATAEPRLSKSGDSCRHSDECVLPLYCAFDSEGRGTCHSQKAADTACTSSMECAGLCGNDGRCIEFCDGR